MTRANKARPPITATTANTTATVVDPRTASSRTPIEAKSANQDPASRLALPKVSDLDIVTGSSSRSDHGTALVATRHPRNIRTAQAHRTVLIDASRSTALSGSSRDRAVQHPLRTSDGRQMPL